MMSSVCVSVCVCWSTSCVCPFWTGLWAPLGVGLWQGEGQRSRGDTGAVGELGLMGPLSREMDTELQQQRHKWTERSVEDVHEKAASDPGKTHSKAAQY